MNKKIKNYFSNLPKSFFWFVIGVVIIVFGIYLGVSKPSAQVPPPETVNWNWANQIGGTGDDKVLGVVTDSSGNSYVTGYFTSSVIFATDECAVAPEVPGACQLSNYAGVDIFIAKFNSSGVLQWAQAAGGAGPESGNAIALDPSEDFIYVTGLFENNTYFYSGTGIDCPGADCVLLTSAGSGDNIFVAKFRTDNGFLVPGWAKNTGFSHGPDQGLAVTVDNNYVYVAGFYNVGNSGDDVTFCPGENNQDIREITNADKNRFVAVHDKESNECLGAILEDNAGNDEALGITTNGTDVYVTGYFTGSATFNDPRGLISPITISSNNISDAFVTKYAWDLVGPGGILLILLKWARAYGGDSNPSVDLARGVKIGSDGNPYVAGIFGGDARNAAIGGLISSDFSYFTSLAFKSDGTPYLAFSDDTLSGRAVVYSFNDSQNSWQQVGGAIGSGFANYTDLAISPIDGMLYVTFSDDGVSNKAVVYSFDGASWNQVGGSMGAGSTFYTNLAIRPTDGVPYITFKDNGVAGQAVVYAFDGVSWNQVGGSVSVGAASNESLAFKSDGTPYLAFADSNASGKAVVYSFDGASWNQVGGVISSGLTDYISLVMRPTDDTPYISFRDNGVAGQAVVYAFDGASWNQVGSAVSSSSSLNTRLAFKSDGTPYLAFSDNNSNDKAVVYSFNGASWNRIGGPMSSGFVDYISIAIRPSDNRPYVAFSRSDTDGRAIVYSVNESQSPYGLGLTATSSADIFLTKLDSSNGNVSWVRRMGGVSSTPPDLTLDGTGVYVTGDFSTTATFDDGAGGTFAGPLSLGSFDVLVAKYNLSGLLQWIKTAGGTGTDSGFGISVDPNDSNDLRIAGTFNRTASFNSFQLTASPLNTPDGFLARLTESVPPVPIPTQVIFTEF